MDDHIDLEFSLMNTSPSPQKKERSGFLVMQFPEETYLDYLNTMQNPEKAQAMHC